jgi:hypothetical protein
MEYAQQASDPVSGLLGMLSFVLLFVYVVRNWKTLHLDGEAE